MDYGMGMDLVLNLSGPTACQDYNLLLMLIELESARLNSEYLLNEIC